MCCIKVPGLHALSCGEQEAMGLTAGMHLMGMHGYKLHGLCTSRQEQHTMEKQTCRMAKTTGLLLYRINS